ncbi:unnamed protein product, partial [Meganyctiphanes norvegica]
PQSFKLKEYGWNWEMHTNDLEICEDRHLPEDNNTFRQSNGNDNQVSKINKISEEDFSIGKIEISEEDVSVEKNYNKKSNLEESLIVKNHVGNYFKEANSIKPKEKKKRRRWKPDEDGMFGCKLCSYKAKQAPYLKKHLITHLSDKPHKCHLCAKTFCHFNSLKIHLDMHNGIRNHHCTVCGCSFIQKVHLKTHMLKHTQEKRHQCEICDKKFTRRDHLKSHVLTHSDERPFACSECDLAFKNKSNLVHH